MNTAFGTGTVLLGQEAEGFASPYSPPDDMERVRASLAGFDGGAPGSLRLFRPRPTAAFAPRDIAAPGYGEAVAAVRGFGFQPVDRPAGGRLAVYDESALVIDLVAPHPEPREHIHARFRDFAAAIAAALWALGGEARVGELPGEYCPGAWSVNGGGRIKLAGIAQRVGRRGYHLGAVIGVRRSDAAEAALAAAYPALGLEFDPATFGTLDDFSQDAGFAATRQAVIGALSGLIGIAGDAG
ncbi:MAG: lipoyl protein ligase domain-containing protein [Paracoccaceae bacterium]